MASLRTLALKHLQSEKSRQEARKKLQQLGMKWQDDLLIQYERKGEGYHIRFLLNASPFYPESSDQVTL
jgi:hypothetical protein